MEVKEDLSNEDVLMEPDCNEIQRFQAELEFVQCLANPNYLNYLAQHKFFKEEEFVNYLAYLLYWKQPQYAKFIKYPQSLHLLDLLQDERFRTELVNVPCVKYIEEQQILHWGHYLRRRLGIANTAIAKKEEKRAISIKKEKS